MLFWKENATLVDDWQARLSGKSFEKVVQKRLFIENDDFKNLNYEDLFDPTKKIEPAQEYWFRRVLRLENQETDAGGDIYTLNNLGGVLWDLVGCNALTWLILFFCLFRGVKSSGKGSGFTFTGQL